jgi:predicted MFS family arabinose efflux permease
LSLDVGILEPEDELTVLGFGGIGKVFSEKNFRIYTVGSITSWTSFFIQLLAINWLTWEITKSTQWLAIISFLDIAPNFIFVPIGSALADKIDRIRIVVITHILALLQALALAVLALTDQITIYRLAVLVALHGLIHSFSVPALYGILPRIISKENLSSAIAANSAYTHLSLFVGPVIAGLLIANFHISAAFFANVLGYLIYLTTIGFLSIPPEQAQPRMSKGILSEVLEGGHYILTHAGIGPMLFLVFIGNAVAFSLFNLLPAFADIVFGRGVDGLSTLMASAGLGAGVGALWLAYRGLTERTTLLSLASFLMVILSVALFVSTTAYLFGIVLVFFFGAGNEIRSTGIVTLIQTSVDDEKRGRVMGAYFLIYRASNAFGMLIIGTAADYFGLFYPMMVMLIFCFAIWLWLFRYRQRIHQAFLG